ncbi:MAG: WbqC family protein [Breznakibacter sp.]
MDSLLVSPTYLGPVFQYAHMYRSPHVFVEQHGHYEKKTYRNRAVVMAANGPMALSVPVEKPAGTKTCDKDILLSYDTPWQANHWRTLVSAYQSSPFFEYYADDFEPFYTQRFKYLMDYNLQLMQTVCGNIGLSCGIYLSDTYATSPADVLDLRRSVSPRVGCQTDGHGDYVPQPYWQVFKEKFGFTPNLSIVDLLFCMGPESIEVLRKSIR